VGASVTVGTGVSAGAMVRGRAGVGFVAAGGLTGVAVAVAVFGGTVGTSDVGSSGAAGVDVAMGNGVGVASWAAPFVGSTSG